MRTDAAPLVRISLPALIRNSTGAVRVDLRRGACGHGFDDVAGALLADTDVRMLVDPGDLARTPHASTRFDVVGEADLAPEVLYGLAGPEPAMRLSGTVLSTKPLRAGEGVSYGHRFRAPEDTRIALVTGGYAHGVPRVVGGAVDVGIAGARHRIVGRIAMDVCVVDIGDAHVDRGTPVTFFGTSDLPVSAWAAASGWSAAEIVASVGRRVRREVIR